MHLPLLYHFRVMSFSNIYTINAWLLLAPSSLCCDWSLGSVPLVTSIADIRNIWSIVLYIGLLTLVLHTLRSKRYELACYTFYRRKLFTLTLLYACLHATIFIAITVSLSQRSLPSWHGTCLPVAPIYTCIWDCLQSRLCNCREVSVLRLCIETVFISHTFILVGCSICLVLGPAC